MNAILPEHDFPSAKNHGYRNTACAPSPDRMDQAELNVHFGIATATMLCHGASVRAGWYQDPATGEPIERNEGEMIALMHSKLSEALEAIRKGLMDDKLPHRPGVEVELADALIRIFDYAGLKDMDLAGAFIEKMRFNRSRPDHKPEARAAAGGKKF